MTTVAAHILLCCTVTLSAHTLQAAQQQDGPPAPPKMIYERPPAEIPSPAGAVRVSSAVMASRLTEKTDPIFPPIARAAHVYGSVTLHVFIARDGHVLNLNVMSGPEMLRSSALTAVRQWRYRPYELNGAPVIVETSVTVHYDPPAPPDRLAKPN